MSPWNLRNTINIYSRVKPLFRSNIYYCFARELAERIFIMFTYLLLVLPVRSCLYGNKLSTFGGHSGHFNGAVIFCREISYSAFLCSKEKQDCKQSRNVGCLKHKRIKDYFSKGVLGWCHTIALRHSRNGSMHSRCGDDAHVRQCMRRHNSLTWHLNEKIFRRVA